MWRKFQPGSLLSKMPWARSCTEASRTARSRKLQLERILSMIAAAKNLRGKRSKRLAKEPAGQRHQYRPLNHDKKTNVHCCWDCDCGRRGGRMVFYQTAERHRRIGPVRECCYPP